MSLLFARLLFDFGLLVLIWIVQLVIYPSFEYYSKAQLVEWHRQYTRGISYVVLPLMLGQLILALFQIWGELSWYTIASISIIAAVWWSTFLQFVPLHGQIAPGNFNKKTLFFLVKNNWWRTGFWTSLFIISLLRLMA